MGPGFGAALARKAALAVLILAGAAFAVGAAVAGALAWAMHP